MIARLSKWFRQVQEKGRHVVLFVPSRDHGPADPVEMMSSVLPPLCEGSPACARVDPKPTSFSAIPKLGRACEASSIVLFAHPTMGFTGFAANGLVGGPPEILTPDWWRRANKPYNMMVAHVCHGKKVLDSQLWRDTFPAWVSYDVSIDAFLVDTRAEHLWGEIAKAIVDAALESRSAQSLCERIRAAYLSKIAELRDIDHANDFLHILHFQQAMDGLVTNERK